ncbi:MAG: hypothetical protein FWD61_04465 [Phycisphaerales bacterium]|nr:hypothetical protein [Phycisphaerales bacterium]
MSSLKWFLFVFAILFSLGSGPANNSMGGAAAGMWIAFALFHVQDRREALERKEK